jgi:hypothetical protein
VIDRFWKGMTRASRSLASAGILLCVAMIGAERANAASIIDYTLLVIGESSGATGNDSIWGYTSLTAAPVELDELPTPQPFYGNGLASDASRNRVLFIDDADTSAGNADALYEYDLTGTGTFTQIGNISTVDTTVSDSSGGGGWYQGEYYYWDDTGGLGSEGLIRVSFNGDGSFASATTFYDPAPADFGDFGDLAIDEHTGVFYATSRGGAGFDFWSLDLNDLASGRIILATGVDYQQLAFDNDGQLVGVERTTLAARNWYLIDTADGSSTTIARLGDFDVFDMASGGLYPIPEPSSLTLVGLGVAALVLRRRTRRGARSGRDSVLSG